MKVSADSGPLFILGIPRSGTTLLESLLDGHSQLLTDVGDSRFFGWYRQARGKPLEEQVRLAERLLLHMWQPEGVYYQRLLAHIPHHAVFGHFRELLEQTGKAPKDFLEAYILAIGLADGSLGETTRYWVEKTPGNEFYLSRLVEWWPEACFIHVIRDPRAVYASYKFRALKNERRAPVADSVAFSWRKSVRQGMQYEERLGDSRYLFVRYEDLVAQLETELQRVIAFLDIRDEPSLRRPTKGHGQIPWGGNAATGVKQFEVHHDYTRIWETKLIDHEIRALETLLHEEMAQMGYTPTNDVARLKPGPKVTIEQIFREIRFLIGYR